MQIPFYYVVIYQRQTQKNNLASFSNAKASPKGKKSRSTRFTPEELRDCFTLKEDCKCDTKRKIGAGWKEYHGEESLLEQDCEDMPLRSLANKKRNELAFVHIVAQKEDNNEMESPMTNINFNDEYDELMNSSSDEEEEEAEFEFE